MRFISEYRDAEAAQQFAQAIARITTRPWTLMEICGGQTHAIVKFGVDALLPEQITLVHGPGCPVCVTPIELIDQAVAIAARPEVIFTSFGDMLRVEGDPRRRGGARGVRDPRVRPALCRERGQVPGDRRAGAGRRGARRVEGASAREAGRDHRRGDRVAEGTGGAAHEDPR